MFVSTQYYKSQQSNLQVQSANSSITRSEFV
jgi:hypothetical protein